MLCSVFLLFLCKEEIHLKRIDLLSLFIGNLLSFQGDQLVGEQLKNAERKIKVSHLFPCYAPTASN